MDTVAAKKRCETVTKRLQEIVTAVTESGAGLSELFVDEWDAAGVAADARDALVECAAALEALEEAQAEVEQLRAEIDHWVQAYSPDIVVYPSAEAVKAVNTTPEFVVGRNALMQVVHEGLLRILRGTKEDE